jgi:hypothetical protein
MNVRNTATEILLQAIRCVSAICEERCSRVIDQLESTSEVSLEVIQSFEGCSVAPPRPPGINYLTSKLSSWKLIGAQEGGLRLRRWLRTRRCRHYQVSIVLPPVFLVSDP